jgi:quercetin dioxygenase-like cupin family protein
MAKKFHDRIIGHSAPITRQEMLKRVARFGEQAPDPKAFPDLADASRKRDVVYMISTNETAGPAAISQPHNFHMAILTLNKGVRPATHAHPYNEVFMPLDAPFSFFWGEDGEESIVLNPLDVISVPAGVFRTFENMEDRPGRVMAIFDYAGDPHANVVVSEEMYEKYYRAAAEAHRLEQAQAAVKASPG